MRPLPRHALPRLVPLAITFALAAHLRGELQFIGILATPERTRFALTDTVTGRTDWLTTHSRFAGHTIAGFDRKTDTLTLTRDADGAELKLRLIDDAKVKSSRLELTGSIAIGAAEKLEITRATLLYDQENVFPLKDGVVYKITPTRRDDGNISYAVLIERTVSTNRMERISSPRVTAGPSQAFKLQLDDYTFEFTPR